MFHNNVTILTYVNTTELYTLNDYSDKCCIVFFTIINFF